MPVVAYDADDNDDGPTRFLPWKCRSPPSLFCLLSKKRGRKGEGGDDVFSLSPSSLCLSLSLPPPAFIRHEGKGEERKVFHNTHTHTSLYL